ncbi:MAG TPA: hypothetical protein VGP50_09435 [Stellaceae bacterium]|nr:hypothetical protein [Stellaceae bacterium]
MTTITAPSLRIELTADGYQVQWRVERQYGRNTVVDLGTSQSFPTRSEAQLWRAAFASALADEEPAPR